MKEDRKKSPGPVPDPGLKAQRSWSRCGRFVEQSQDLGCARSCGSGGSKIDLLSHNMELYHLMGEENRDESQGSAAKTREIPS